MREDTGEQAWRMVNDHEPDAAEQVAKGRGNILVNRSPGARIDVVVNQIARTVPLLPAALPLDPAMSPARLVQARSRLVPYTARPELFEELKTWLTGPGPFRARLIGGRGGSGKTRLGVELAVWAESLEATWLAGLLTTDADGGQSDQLIATALPRLVVIDYAETRLGQLNALLPRLAAAATDAHPVRVLLLVRDRPNAGQDLRSLLRDHTDDLDAIIDRVELEDLDDPPVEQRRALFTAAAGAFLGHIGSTEPAPEPPDHLDDPVYANPLLATIAAYLSVRSVELPVSRDGLLEGLLVHEGRHWAATSKGLDLDADLCRRVVALGTLAGAVDEADASAMLRHIPDLASVDSERLARIARWMRGLYLGAAYWNPLEPDLLGEHLVATTWGTTPSVLAAAVTDRPREATRHALLVLTRVANDRPDLSQPLSDLLTGRIVDLTALAVEEASTPEGYERYFTGNTLAAAITRAADAMPPSSRTLPIAISRFPSRPDVVLSPLRITLSLQLIEALRLEDRNDDALPWVLSDVSNELAFVGRPKEALAAIDEAVRLRRVLAEHDPAVRIHLAGSLSNLAGLLDLEDRADEALGLAQEAVERWTEIDAGSEGFTPFLAMAKHNLAIRLATLDRVEEAIATIEDAISIRRKVAGDGDELAAADLAGSLNNLAIYLTMDGREEEAIELGNEVTARWTELAESNPVAYSPQVGKCSQAQAMRLKVAGRADDALPLAVRARQITGKLFEANPRAHAHSFALALDTLAVVLSALGHHDKAAAALEHELAVWLEYRPGIPSEVGQMTADVIRLLLIEYEALGRHDLVAEIRSMLPVGGTDPADDGSAGEG